MTLGSQVAGMKRLWPNFDCAWTRNRVTWTGTLQPSAMSAVYAIRIEYALESIPRVFVVSPKLERHDGERIPHMHDEERLCLYLPRTGEWTARHLIAETIVPWASLWLLYYETWRATGEWLGGGEHPKVSEATIERWIRKQDKQGQRHQHKERSPA